MISKGIRGAITVEENSSEAIGSATIKLLTEIVKRNNIEPNMISHAIFSLTKDLDADFPAKYARIDCGFNKVPMMCYNELNVENSQLHVKFHLIECPLTFVVVLHIPFLIPNTQVENLF